MISRLSKIKLLSKICLLAIVGILVMSSDIKVYAINVADDLENELISNVLGAETGTSNLDIADSLNISFDNGEADFSSSLKILITLTAIALAPIMLILLTSFTRIIIVLHFTRTALGTQTAPPNQVLLGLALFLTFFIMGPILTQINEEAIKPFDQGSITQEEAIEKGMQPIREFMYGQIEPKDLKLFIEIAGLGNETIDHLDEIPNSVLIPSFVISELRTAFIIGFLIYIPFIVIDMVVASTLMSMGMMMLPPTTISMPFKILLFVLADGWNLIIGNVVKTFY